MNLIWLILFLILLAYAICKYAIKSFQKYAWWNSAEKAIQAFLLFYGVIGIFLSHINPIIETTEYAKINTEGIIELKHNIISISRVQETTDYLTPVQQKNYSFQKNKLKLNTHLPKTQERFEKYLYEIIYTHRKF